MALGGGGIKLDFDDAGYVNKNNICMYMYICMQRSVDVYVHV